MYPDRYNCYSQSNGIGIAFKDVLVSFHFNGHLSLYEEPISYSKDFISTDFIYISEHQDRNNVCLNNTNYLFSLCQANGTYADSGNNFVWYNDKDNRNPLDLDKCKMDFHYSCRSHTIVTIQNKISTLNKRSRYLNECALPCTFALKHGHSSLLTNKSGTFQIMRDNIIHNSVEHNHGQDDMYRLVAQKPVNKLASRINAMRQETHYIYKKDKSFINNITNIKGILQSEAFFGYNDYVLCNEVFMAFSNDNLLHTTDNRNAITRLHKYHYIISRPTKRQYHYTNGYIEEIDLNVSLIVPILTSSSSLPIFKGKSPVGVCNGFTIVQMDDMVSRRSQLAKLLNSSLGCNLHVEINENYLSYSSPYAGHEYDKFSQLIGQLYNKCTHTLGSPSERIHHVTDIVLIALSNMHSMSLLASHIPTSITVILPHLIETSCGLDNSFHILSDSDYKQVYDIISKNISYIINNSITARCNHLEYYDIAYGTENAEIRLVQHNNTCHYTFTESTKYMVILTSLLATTTTIFFLIPRTLFVIRRDYYNNKVPFSQLINHYLRIKTKHIH